MHFDLVMIFKILHGQIDSNSHEFTSVIDSTREVYLNAF